MGVRGFRFFGLLLSVASAFAQVPPPQISPTTLPLAAAGQVYRFQLSATGPAPHFWTLGNFPNLIPAGLSLTQAGLISGVPTRAGQFQFPVTVISANQQTGTATLTLTIVQVETESPLPNGRTGVAYSQQFAVTGGAPAWSLASGQIPPGLALGDNGILSGTPTITGTFNFTVRATIPNTSGADAVAVTKSFTVTIEPGPLTLLTTSLPDGLVGADYSATVRAAGGVSPYIITATNTTLPPGLTFIGSQLLSGRPTTAGTYNIQFQIRDDTNTTVTRSLPLNILPAGGGLLTLAPTAMRFTAFEGAGPTPWQNLLITSNTAAPANFTSAIVPQSSWLAVSNVPNTTPAQTRIRANPSGLRPGTYTAAIRITPTGAGGAAPPTVELPITFVVSAAAPKLDFAPRVIQHSSRTLNPTRAVTISLRNTGGGATADYSARLAQSSSWIRNLTGASGRLLATDPSLIRFTLDSSGLRPGAYRDELIVTSSIGEARIPIAIFIEQPGPILSVGTRGIRLTARQGDSPAVAREAFFIRNRGSAGTTLNWTARIVRGDNVFGLVPASGTATPTSPSTMIVTLTPGATDRPGPRTALLRIDAPGAQGSPEYVVLIADVAPASSAPSMQLSPTGLVFLGVAGGAVPAPQTFSVITGAISLPYTVSSSTNEGGNWLSVASPTGTATGGTAGSVRVNVTPGNLPAGVYTGLVTVGAGTQVASTAITFILLPAGARLSPTDTKSLATPQRAEGCNPAKLAISQTTLAESFNVPAGWPATITARLYDDCGTGINSGDLVASFSNGDAPIVMEPDPSGLYLGTWQPGAATTGATVTLEATAGALTPAKLDITGQIGPNSVSIPSLVTAGLLNNLNPLVGAPLAPGTVTQVYGDNLTTQPDAPTTVPLPSVYKGVEAIIGGLSSPIYYISKNQLTVQVPAELDANRVHTAILATDTGYSLPIQIGLVPVAPGTVAFPDGNLVAQHGDYSLVTAARPARRSEILTVYLVGMGATAPAVPSGTAAPFGPLAQLTTAAQVTVDGTPAEILFQGLTPGGVGLYQINFRVPANARFGSLPVVITQDGTEANRTQLIVAAQ